MVTDVDARALGAAIARLEAGGDPALVLAAAGSMPTRIEGGPGDLAAHADVDAALRLSEHTGAPLAATLRRVAAELARRERAAAARAAALEGVATSARVLAALPWVGVAMAAALEPGTIDLLTTRPVGWALVTVGVALAWAGRRWLRALERRARLAGAEDAPVCLALALCEAALATGVAVPGGVEAVGRCLGARGERLRDAGVALGQGAAWDDAWALAGSPWAAVQRALAPGWWHGASPVPAIVAEREALARELDAAAGRAAARLEVQSTLPLALCLLPSFVVLGVLPLVIAVAGAAAAAGAG